HDLEVGRALQPELEHAHDAPPSAAAASSGSTHLCSAATRSYSAFGILLALPLRLRAPGPAAPPAPVPPAAGSSSKTSMMRATSLLARSAWKPSERMSLTALTLAMPSRTDCRVPDTS